MMTAQEPLRAGRNPRGYPRRRRRIGPEVALACAQRRSRRHAPESAEVNLFDVCQFATRCCVVFVPTATLLACGAWGAGSSERPGADAVNAPPAAAPRLRSARLSCIRVSGPAGSVGLQALRQLECKDPRLQVLLADRHRGCRFDRVQTLAQPGRERTAGVRQLACGGWGWWRAQRWRTRRARPGRAGSAVPWSACCRREGSRLLPKGPATAPGHASALVLQFDDTWAPELTYRPQPAAAAVAVQRALCGQLARVAGRRTPLPTSRQGLARRGPRRRERRQRWCRHRRPAAASPAPRKRPPPAR